MSTFVPDTVQKDLDAARLARLKSSSRMRIETPDGYFRILRLGHDGFTVAAEDAPHLRGLVDVYDGPTQLFQCLIVASREEAGEMHYEFKRATAVADRAALDFVAEALPPVALIDDAGVTS